MQRAVRISPVVLALAVAGCAKDESGPGGGGSFDFSVQGIPAGTSRVAATAEWPDGSAALEQQGPFDGGTHFAFPRTGLSRVTAVAYDDAGATLAAEILDPARFDAGPALDGGAAAAVLLPFASDGGFMQPCLAAEDGGCAGCADPRLESAFGFCTRRCGSGCSHGYCWNLSTECYGALVAGSSCWPTGPLPGASPGACYIYCDKDGGGCPPSLSCPTPQTLCRHQALAGR